MKAKREKGWHRLLVSFTGKYAFLSNTFPAPILYEGAMYLNVDHAFQEAKDKYKKGWTQIQDSVMEDLVRQKFTNYTHFKIALVATRDRDLFAGYIGDRYWGVEHEFNCWHGENKLGKILMKLREEFRATTDPDLLVLNEQDGIWNRLKIDIPLPEGMWNDLMLCTAAVKYAHYNGPTDLISDECVVIADRVQQWLSSMKEKA